MSRPVARAIAGAILLALGLAGGIAIQRYVIQPRQSPSESAKTKAEKLEPPAGDEEVVEPAAVVHTVAAKQGELTHTIEGFGAAAAPPTSVVSESWPADIVITRVLVQSGQPIAKDEPFAEVAPTRDAETQLAAAQLSIDSLQKALDLAQQRLDRGLTTRPEVLTAQSGFDEARQRLQRLQTGLPPKDGLLRAHSEGLVATVRAQSGTTLTAGSPIIDITSGTVVAQIGFDPADAPLIAIGQSLDVVPIDDHRPNHWQGTVTLIASAMNPATRLIDYTISLRGDSPPRVGVPLKARATLPGVSGVLIPRAALIPDGDDMIVYIVRDGAAKRSLVTISLRGREQVVLSSGCSAGDHVIVSGQGQLTPGAAVREVTDQPAPPQTHPDGGPGADH